MKTNFLLTTIFGFIATHAIAQSTIIWQTPQTISGPGDVSTLGLYFGSWAPYNFPAYDAGGLTVNGVTFQASSDLPDVSYNASGGYGGYTSPNTSDANYNTLLESGGDIAGTTLNLTWDGMTVGDTYLVQFWVNDGRSYGEGRTETLTGGTILRNHCLSVPISVARANLSLENFVATAPSETIAVDGNQDSLMNLLQVRDITAVPEPSTLALLGMGAGVLGGGLRWKCRRN